MRQGRQRPARNGESGYALLLVFLMAAVIAISLYKEIPRVAFQSQRHKEQLLMERGEQYMRAIQVFQQANPNQFPRNLDDLKSFQNRHYLRHEYIDPMTGKSEWRIIHQQGGVLTDSLVTKPQDPNQSAGAGGNSSGNSYSGNDPYGAAQMAGMPQNQRPQDRRRASDMPGAPGQLGGAFPDGTGQNPDDSGENPAAPQQAGLPGQQIPGMPPPGAPGAPGSPGQQTQAGMPGQPSMPGQTVTPGMPGQIGAGTYPQTGPYSTAGPSTGFPGQPGMPATNQQGPNSASNLINRILMQPRTGGIASVGSPAGSGMGGNTMGGGVAGVASKAEQQGIMVYNDRTAYKEWEFVFDPSKVIPVPPPGNGLTGSTPANQMSSGFGQNPGQQTGGSGFPMSTRPGATPLAGRQTGMMPGGMPGMQGMQGGAQGPGTQTSGPAGMQTSGGPAAVPQGLRMGRP